MLADENCLGQFVMSEMLAQRLVLNQGELLPKLAAFAGRLRYLVDDEISTGSGSDRVILRQLDRQQMQTRSLSFLSRPQANSLCYRERLINKASSVGAR